MSDVALGDCVDTALGGAIGRKSTHLAGDLAAVFTVDTNSIHPCAHFNLSIGKAKQNLSCCVKPTTALLNAVTAVAAAACRVWREDRHVANQTKTALQRISMKSIHLRWLLQTTFTVVVC